MRVSLSQSSDSVKTSTTEAVATAHLESRTVNKTSRTPDVSKLCVGFSSLEKEPSAKSHRYVTGQTAQLRVLVNRTFDGAISLSALACIPRESPVNSVGVFEAPLNTSTVDRDCEKRFVEVSLTVSRTSQVPSPLRSKFLRHLPVAVRVAPS